MRTSGLPADSPDTSAYVVGLDWRIGLPLVEEAHNTVITTEWTLEATMCAIWRGGNSLPADGEDTFAMRIALDGGHAGGEVFIQGSGAEGTLAEIPKLELAVIAS